MNNLIKVSIENDRATVLGRELHEFLEVKTAYKDWFPRMCEYGFTENVDFNPLNFEQVQLEGTREVTRNFQDHQLTIETAKEISMLQRNEKGKQARQYFIQLEKDWNSPEKIMARALQIADKQIFTLKATIEEQQPKVLFADAVTASKTSILVGELAKILKQNNINIGQNRMFEWLRKNSYLISRRGTDYNMPTQKSMELKLFEIKEHTHLNGTGSAVTTKTPKVTGKGQVYFINKMLADTKIETIVH